jgi:hypothetical protein
MRDVHRSYPVRYGRTEMRDMPVCPECHWRHDPPVCPSGSDVRAPWVFVGKNGHGEPVWVSRRTQQRGFPRREESCG